MAFARPTVKCDTECAKTPQMNLAIEFLLAAAPTGEQLTFKRCTVRHKLRTVVWLPHIAGKQMLPDEHCVCGVRNHRVSCLDVFIINSITCMHYS